MSHKNAAPETEVQRAVREHWQAALGATTVGWGRDKHGKFLSEFARQCEAAWIAAAEHANNAQVH